MNDTTIAEAAAGWLDSEDARTTAPRRAPSPFGEEASATDVLRQLTEFALAERFVASQRSDIRRVASGWMLWQHGRTGGYWLHTLDDGPVRHLVADMLSGLLPDLHVRTDRLTTLIERYPRDVQSLIAERAALSAASNRIATAKAVMNVTRLVRDHDEMTDDMQSFDARPYLLNCSNGTVDLTTGELRPHAKEDRLTHRVGTPYNPDSSCPLWEKTLAEVFCQDQELVEWFQRAVGYSMTGDVSAQVLFFLHGSGSNGKSTVMNVLRDLLGGQLVVKVASQALMAAQASSGQAATPEVAKLRGKRFALASELADSRFNEATIKDIVSEDEITARYLNSNPFDFWPTHKLWMFGNHRPAIAGTDDGIWRRIRLVPFTARFEGKGVDPELPAKLTAERAGVLAWAVRGAQAWAAAGKGARGLGHCRAVDDATAAYREETDVIGEFIASCCEVDAAHEERSGTLYKAYKRWAQENGHGVQSSTRFGRSLEARGYVGRRSNGIVRTGIKLAGLPDEPW